MITVEIKGGIGNQLFQYAFARSLAIELNDEIELDKSWYYWNSLLKKNTKRSFVLNSLNTRNVNITQKRLRYAFARTINKFKVVDFPFTFNKTRYIVEQKFGYDPNVYKADYENKYFIGFWQSYKYFSNIRRILLSEIKPNFVLSPDSISLIKSARSTDSIAVHFRRGDYLINSKTRKFHGICSLDYYKNALDFISKNIRNPLFFVFSDDIKWVKGNFHFNSATIYIDSNYKVSDLESLWIMKNCKHFVIANSTFSWWGAWLSTNDHKIVVAPKKWFNNDVDTSDLIPKDWIRI